MRKLLMLFTLLPFVPMHASAQVVATKFTVTFATVGDDKDWNTQPRDTIRLNGKTIAELDCCSADRNGDHWSNHSVQKRDMHISGALAKADVPRATFEFGMTPTGHDKWDVIPTLTVYYSDGSKDEWTYDKIYLESNNNYTQRTYHMDGNLHPM